jgi:hypothetical protein
LITDGKDSNDRVHLVNVLLATPLGISFNRTVEFNTTTRDAANTAALYIRMIEELPDDIRNNLVLLVTDAPKVNVAAARSVEEKFSHITWIPCLTHQLNLFFKDIMAFPAVRDLYAEVKDVVHHFHARSFARSLLRKTCQTNRLKIKGVKSICELRFGNAIVVMARLHRCMSGIQTVVVSDTHKNWVSGLPAKDKATCQRVVDLVLSKNFWLGVESYVHALNSVYCLLRQVDSNSLMMGKVYPELSKIDDHLGAYKPDVFNGCDMPQAFVARWDNLHTMFHCAGEECHLSHAFRN